MKHHDDVDYSAKKKRNYVRKEVTKFTKVPPVHIMTKKNFWKLAGEMSYSSEYLNGRVVIPEGFVTDLASIPRIFTPLIPIAGRHRLAGILHDYMYATGGCYGLFSRETCDIVFLEAMEHLGVKWFRRKIMYLTVRMFGGSSFKSSHPYAGY